MGRYLLTDLAIEDLREIRDHIAHDDRSAARMVLRDLRGAMAGLAERPRKGHVRPDLTDEDVRFWSVHTFLIVYRPESRPLEVVRVLSAWRDVRTALEDRPSG